MRSENSHEFTYKEVLRPPVWVLAFLLFLFGSLSLSIWAAFNNLAGAISFLAGLTLAALFREKFSMTILVTSQEIRVNEAHIEKRFCGKASALSADEMRLVRGRDADPAAFLAIRFWQPLGIKITLQDDRDPTPYWLISSKHPMKLVDAISKG